MPVLACVAVAGGGLVSAISLMTTGPPSCDCKRPRRPHLRPVLDGHVVRRWNARAIERMFSAPLLGDGGGRVRELVQRSMLAAAAMAVHHRQEPAKFHMVASRQGLEPNRNSLPAAHKHGRLYAAETAGAACSACLLAARCCRTLCASRRMGRRRLTCVRRDQPGTCDVLHGAVCALWHCYFGFDP